MPFDGSNFKRLVKQISQGDYFEPAKPSRKFIDQVIDVDLNSTRFSCIAVNKGHAHGESKTQGRHRKNLQPLVGERKLQGELFGNIGRPR